MSIFANRIVHGSDPDDPLDYFPFEDMRGALQPRSEGLEIIVRPGHDGETMRKTGVRAPESRIVTVHFVLDWEAAATAIVAYNTLKDGNPYLVIQHGVQIGYFRVVEVVQLPETRACGRVVNSILEAETADLPTVMQYCGWTLISTEAPD